MTSEVGEVEDAVDQAVRWVAEAAQRANHNSDDARALLREALSQDIPVIVGLNQLNEQAFKDFTSEVAVSLPPNIESAMSWVKAAQSFGG